MSFKPTAEQVAAVDAFNTTENMTLTAVAGSGKSSSLRLMSGQTKRVGLYLAFSKAVQIDASASFPSNVMCRTVHSLAYRDTVKPWMRRRMEARRQTGFDVARILGIEDTFSVGEQQLKPQLAAQIARDTVKRFCYSADAEIAKWHVPRQDWATEDHEHEALRDLILPFAIRAWSDVTSSRGRLKFEHDHYVKLFGLSRPRLGVDFVMLDEAQDASPVMVDILRNQDCQVVAVGDENQSIFGWRGAVDAMTAFRPRHTLPLSQSFRFGPAVADEANKWLDLLDAKVRVVGTPSIGSTVGPVSTPDAVLCRTNAGAMERVMAELAQHRKVALVGGAEDIRKFAEAAERLMAGKSVSHPDLSPFKSWDSVKGYVVSDESGKDLAVNVRLVDKYGCRPVMDACSAAVNEEHADVIVSTAHRSKGREWNRVQIGPDFPMPKEGKPVMRADGMLAYVAVTRAKNRLDTGSLSWIDSVNITEGAAA